MPLVKLVVFMRACSYFFLFQPPYVCMYFSLSLSVCLYVSLSLSLSVYVVIDPLLVNRAVFAAFCTLCTGIMICNFDIVSVSFKFIFPFVLRLMLFFSSSTYTRALRTRTHPAITKDLPLI